MKYVASHPRQTRGAAVSRTLDERKKEAVIKEKERQVEEEFKKNKFAVLERVEEKFLTPKSENFIVTEQVEKYEDRALLWLKAGYPIHLIGPTGCGKTALAVHLAEKLKKPVIWINGDEELTTHELIGGYSKVEIKSIRDKYIHNVHKSVDIIEPQWVANPLALACKNGYTLIYNEFSRSKPEANNILLSVLEEGVLELPTKFGEDRYIKVHPDFNLILTSNNVEYAGIHQPQDALLDRIASIYMNYYDKKTEIDIVCAHSKIGEKDAGKIVNVIRGLRKQLKGVEAPGTRPAIMIAKGIQACNGAGEELFEQICLDAISSKTKNAAELEKKREIIRKAIKEEL